MFAKNIENLEKLRYYIFKITLSLSIVYGECSHEYKKIFEEEDSTKILKISWFNY